jgi:ABC-type multidrug transport system ATPase subunit
MAEQCATVRCCELEVCVGTARVLRNVTFACCAGDWVIVTGPGGAGKSTLLRAINGLCPPAGGHIWALQRVWRSTATVLQELALFETKSAIANVDLSDRAIASHPELLILDGPTAHLDDGSARIVLAAVKELVHQGATVVMSNHREEESVSLRTCRIVLEQGERRSTCR